LSFPLASSIARGLEAIRRLRSRSLGVLLVIKGSPGRSRSKKALAMSFFLKGVSFCNSGLGVVLTVEGSPERSRSKKALAMSFLLKGVPFCNSGIVAYPALRDNG
jgi:hypothetical protein